VLACDGIWYGTVRVCVCVCVTSCLFNRNQITNQQCVDFIRGRLQEEASRTLSGICEEVRFSPPLKQMDRQTDRQTNR
jgi:hypothetical protein